MYFLFLIQIKEFCRSSLSKLEHIIRPRNDTLFFPLESQIQVPQSTQNELPENKTNFLSGIIKDLDILKKIDNIKQNTKLSNTLLTTNVTKCDDKIEVASQEVINNNVQEFNKEKEIVQPTISEISDKFCVKTQDNIDFVKSNQITESMAMGNNISSIAVDESINEELDNTNITEMLKDFIESD